MVLNQSENSIINLAVYQSENNIINLAKKTNYH